MHISKQLQEGGRLLFRFNNIYLICIMAVIFLN